MTSERFKRCINDEAGITIRRKLGHGTEGIVFSSDNPEVVVKIAQIYGNWGNNFWQGFSSRHLKYFSRLKNAAVVKLLGYGRCQMPNKKSYYYYIMPKLYKLSYLEAHSIIEWYEAGDHSLSKRSKKFFTNKRNFEKAKDFISRCRKLRYTCHDAHRDNIMKDADGNYYFIDLESFYWAAF